MMENISTNDVHAEQDSKKDLKDVDESALNFQKFIYELFEKKGVLNDLRANLRGHIVEVLKSAQSGETPTCQKHFTQRLELSYQAVNILIAEYFLRMEFNYTLSVFVSEIPLANMVFDFAKTLIRNKDIENLKFKESDVWSILNYLGVKCDSNWASNIWEMYIKETAPLLLCILNCTAVYHQDSVSGQDNVSSVSLSSSVRSANSLDKDIHMKNPSKIASVHDHCRHFASCKVCQARMQRMKEKYKRSKKAHVVKNVKSWNRDPENVKMVMTNIGDVEQNLVDEMFQELKGVYEAELDMIKQNDVKVVKRSLASHALQLQKRREEMEESFKSREEQLERNVREKKEFLWGLARALRHQHAHMTRAMHAVRTETDRLTAKEESLKSQLLEAENVLKKRGEEMRKQISEELVVLESHLESMKRERDNINKERKELEEIKSACDCNSQVIKVHDLTNDELRSHYDLLKDELSILRKYLETTKVEPKCVIERSTLTEMSNATSKINMVLNNEQDLDRNFSKSDSGERIRSPNKVVNDLKKQKNVNFCTSQVDEIYRENCRDRSRSSVSSESALPMSRDGQDRDIVERLREENERLKTFARQQREHIDELTSHGARLRAELTARSYADRRPRTAPATFAQSVNAKPNAVGWRKGAGEEMSIFSNAQPRILLPGDTLPFVGALRDRHTDSRRHLINQWRSLRRSGAGISNTKAHISSSALSECSPPVKYTSPSRTTRVSPTRVPHTDENYPHIDDIYQQADYNQPSPPTRQRPKIQKVEAHGTREKSPKSVLKEAREKLIKYNYTREQPSSSRDMSPTAVLREAKTRLRKLEIEAEAVEKSYLDFRRRQEQMKKGQGEDYKSRPILINHNKETKLGAEPHTYLSKKPTISGEFGRYQTIIKGLTDYKPRSPTLEHKRPIPSAYSKLEERLKESQQRQIYYLETPLEEFRKLYHSQRSPTKSEKSFGGKSSVGDSHKDLDITAMNEVKELVTPDEEKNSISVFKDDNPDDLTEQKIKSARRLRKKKYELEILKDNINKIYNLNQDFETKIAPIEETIDTIDVRETEISITDISAPEEIKNSDSDRQHPELLLEVENTVDTKEIDIPGSDLQHEKISTQMTIIVTPKMDELNESIKENHERSMTPEQAAKLTRNDVLNAIFHADLDKVFSSVETELDVEKREEVVSELEAGADDYPDDFSADVDNYNNQSDYEVSSPISLPKTSEDENFWDT